MAEQDWQKWFEEIWERREEYFFRGFFGDMGKGIYTLTQQTFAAIGVADPDPRFLFHGVFECPPSERHADWIYVSSGMSNAWGDSPETADPGGYSGLGCEYVLHTSSRQQWAIQILHWLMAVQLAVASGKMEGGLLQRHDRVGIGNGIPTKDGPGLITHLLVCSPEELGMIPDVPRLCYPAEFGLATGKVEMLTLVGITSRERDFAKSQDVPGLVTLLHHHGVFPRTEPGRQSLV
jgi:hypothetical protein